MESFSFIWSRHFFHWATDECTYRLEQKNPSLRAMALYNSTGEDRAVGGDNLLSILCSQPHCRQQAVHLLGFLSHQVLLAGKSRHSVSVQVRLIAAAEEKANSYYELKECDCTGYPGYRLQTSMLNKKRTAKVSIKQKNHFIEISSTLTLKLA